MGFEKGKPRHPNAGRKAGTPHKKSLLVKEILENKGINLIDDILKLVPGLDDGERVKALTALLPYVYPKLNATEISTGDEGFIVKIVDYGAKKP